MQRFLPDLLSIPEGSKLRCRTPVLRSWRPLPARWFRILCRTAVPANLSVAELDVNKLALFDAAPRHSKPAFIGAFFLKSTNSKMYPLSMSALVPCLILISQQTKLEKTQCHKVYHFWEVEGFLLAFPRRGRLPVGVISDVLSVYVTAYTCMWNFNWPTQRTLWNSSAVPYICLGTCGSFARLAYSNISVRRGKCLQILKSKEGHICWSDCTSVFVLHGTFIPGFIRTEPQLEL